MYLCTNFIVLEAYRLTDCVAVYIKLTLIPSFHKYLAFHQYSLTVHLSHQRILHVRCHFEARSIFYTYSVLHETLKAFNHAEKI